MSPGRRWPAGKDANANANNPSLYIHIFSGENLHFVLGNHALPNDSMEVLSKKTLIDFLTNERSKEELCNLITNFFISDKMAIGEKFCQIYQVKVVV